MVSSRSSQYAVLEREPQVATPQTLVEQGLACLEQHRHTEALLYFRQARELLFPHQTQLLAALDTLQAATSSHLQAQQALHEASKRFAESSLHQQTQISYIQHLLQENEIHKPCEDPDASPSPRPSAAPLLYLTARTTEHARAHQARPATPAQSHLPALTITCFGHFTIRRAGLLEQPLELCHNAKGKALLRYLIAQPRHSASMDTLMDLFWPDEAPHEARHKLQVAISALRRSLNQDLVDEPGGGYIICKGQHYQLNPTVAIHSDVDEFLELYQAGQQAGSDAEATRFFEQACNLFTGPFLSEDLYTDWSSLRREELEKLYGQMCARLTTFHMAGDDYEEAIRWSMAILKVNRYDEEAHCQLIRAYAALGRRSEALRQYRYCQRVLVEELGMQLLPETQTLFASLFQ